MASVGPLVWVVPAHRLKVCTDVACWGPHQEHPATHSPTHASACQLPSQSHQSGRPSQPRQVIWTKGDLVGPDGLVRGALKEALLSMELRHPHIVPTYDYATSRLPPVSGPPPRNSQPAADATPAGRRPPAPTHSQWTPAHLACPATYVYL